MRRRVAVVIGLACLVACSKAEAPPPASEPAPAPPPPAASGAAPATPTAAPLEPAPTPMATATAGKPTEARPSAPKSTPAPDRGLRKIAVHANNRFACTGGEKREDVLASPEPHGARITITGQGPCPGEVHDWAAEVNASRVDVHATHGAPSKCRCSGTGDLVLRGLDPGTYDVHVNGGFDRPIAARVVVPQ